MNMSHRNKAHRMWYSESCFVPNQFDFIAEIANAVYDLFYICKKDLKHTWFLLQILWWLQTKCYVCLHVMSAKPT